MIASIMTVLRVLVGLIIIFFVAYVIIKVLAYKEQHQIVIEPEEQIKSRPRQIEIKSKDLYMEAENIIATHDVYGLQLDDIVNKISSIEQVLDRWRRFQKLSSTFTIDQVIREKSNIVSDTEAEYLISKSLKLQEQKCKIEAKILKLMKQLDKIAEEEYRRQADTE